jgi:hypothetical protein
MPTRRAMAVAVRVSSPVISWRQTGDWVGPQIGGDPAGRHRPRPIDPGVAGSRRADGAWSHRLHPRLRPGGPARNSDASVSPAAAGRGTADSPKRGADLPYCPRKIWANVGAEDIIWALTGANFFWPVFPDTGLGHRPGVHACDIAGVWTGSASPGGWK